MANTQGFKIGERVRLRGRSECGTVFANSYTFQGVSKTGVTWDHAPKHVLSVETAALVRVTSEPVGVPPEARPLSVGALRRGSR